MDQPWLGTYWRDVPLGGCIHFISSPQNIVYWRRYSANIGHFILADHDLYRFCDFIHHIDAILEYSFHSIAVPIPLFNVRSIDLVVLVLFNRTYIS